MKTFYLFPDDLGDVPLFYKCSYQKTIIIPNLSKEVWLVKIGPKLPTWLSNFHSIYESELLGLVTVQNSWTLDRVGEFGFIVEVLIVKDIDMVHKEPISAAFSRIGTGVISITPDAPQLSEQ